MNDVHGRLDTSNAFAGGAPIGKRPSEVRCSASTGAACSWNAAKSSSYGDHTQPNASVSGRSTVYVGCTTSHTAGAPSMSVMRRASCRCTTLAIAHTWARYVFLLDAASARTKAVASSSTVVACVHGTRSR